MSGQVEARLQEKGIVLPDPAPPAANYVPFVITGNQIWISGQIPMWNGDLRFVGKVGIYYKIEEGMAAAELCALNILSQAKAAVGDLDKITRVVKLGGFVNCPPDFTAHPQVINGASNLMINAFGDAGKHARAAVGAGSLPLNVAVEVDAVLEFSS